MTNNGLKQLSKLLISIMIEEEKLARQETEVVCLRAFYHPRYSPIILKDRKDLLTPLKKEGTDLHSPVPELNKMAELMPVGPHSRAFSLIPPKSRQPA